MVSVRMAQISKDASWNLTTSIRRPTNGDISSIAMVKDSQSYSNIAINLMLQVVYRNDSIITKAAVKVWDLIEKVESRQIKELVDTLTKRKTQKLHLDCSDCKPNGEFCNCTFLGIMSENTMNIDFLLERNSLSWRWCPSQTVISDMFKCNQNLSISSKMICDKFHDCPDGLDETLALCSPEEFFYMVPVIAFFVNSFALAFYCISKCRHTKNRDNRDEIQEENIPNPRDIMLLKDLKDFLASPSMLKENMLLKRLNQMGLQDRVELLKITYNIETKQAESSGQMMRTVVQMINSTNAATKAILSLVKDSKMPTAFKTRVIDLVKMGSTTKKNSYFDDVIPAKQKTYFETAFGICKTIGQICAFPSQDIKDLAVIAKILNFHYNVIQERSNLIDNIPLLTISGLLLTIYSSVQLLKMTILRSTDLSLKPLRCFPLGFDCNPKWIPFFSESSLGIYKIKKIWQISELKMSIVKTMEDIETERGDTYHLWQDVMIKSAQVNQFSVELERQDCEGKKIKMTAVVGDVLQGAVILVLLLRADLRIRGILGLSKLESRLNAFNINVDNRNWGVSGLYCYLDCSNQM